MVVILLVYVVEQRAWLGVVAPPFIVRISGRFA
jgi:hypothetical protein